MQTLANINTSFFIYRDGCRGASRARPKNSPPNHSVYPLWTLYLDDDFDIGKTEFLFHERKIAPRTGSLLHSTTRSGSHFAYSLERRPI